MKEPALETDLVKRLKNNQGGDFIGRHQQGWFVLKFMGGKAPEMELRIAANKDKKERDEVLNKIEKLENFIGSEDFTHKFAVGDAYKEILEIMDLGYSTCVLQNDKNLEERCLKILRETTECFKNLAENEGKEINPEKVEHLLGAQGFLHSLNLGGLLAQEDDNGTLSNAGEKAWFLLRGLTQPQSLMLFFLLYPISDTKEMVDGLKDFANKLLAQDRIDENQLEEIDNFLEDGLAASKEHQK